MKETCSNIEIEQNEIDSHKVLMGDGTKIKGNKNKHEIRALISLSGNNLEKNLLRLKINKSWREIAKSINLDQYEVFVGDGEPGLDTAFCEKGMQFHFCHEHAKRDLAFYLWKEGLSKKDYTAYVNTLKSILHTLQNSTIKHRKDKDWIRLLWRIKWTMREINSLATTLSCRGLFKSAEFLMRRKQQLTTASRMAIKGIKVPFSTNVIERTMKEVGIRTKKKGMYWSEKGAYRIISIVMKRYFMPMNQRYYKDVFTTKFSNGHATPDPSTSD